MHALFGDECLLSPPKSTFLKNTIKLEELCVFAYVIIVILLMLLLFIFIIS